MARRDGSSGIGCGSIFFAVVLVVLLGAWYFGLFDRLAYLVSVEQSRVSSQGADSGDAAGSMSLDGSEGADGRQESEVARYAYSQLDDADREKYDILLDAFQTRQPRTYPKADLDDLSRIRDCVMADHPELFYAGSVHLRTTTNRGSGLVTDVTVEGDFTCSEEDQAATAVLIDAAADEWISQIGEAPDDYSKAKGIYELLAVRTEYDHGAIVDGQDALEVASGQTIADVLVSGRAMCAGYARTFQYLLQRLGVACVYVSGTARGSGHAWCAAFLDGAWYFVDPTWGDPQFLDEWGNAADYGSIDYDYLCVTGADIAATHAVESTYPVPECISIADNYYMREGAYLSDADVGRVGELVNDAIVRGESATRFRCATHEVYDELLSRLFDGQEIYQYLPGNSCRYASDEDMLTVSLWF